MSGQIPLERKGLLIVWILGFDIFLLYRYACYEFWNENLGGSGLT